MWSTAIVEDKNGKKLVKLQIITGKTSQGMIFDKEDAVMIGSSLIETVSEIDAELAKDSVDNIQVEE